MLFRFALVFYLLVLSTGLLYAQDVEYSKPVCFEPSSPIFDEFPYISVADLTPKATEFKAKLFENPESQGIVFVYAGKRTKINEVAELTSKIEKVFNIGKTGYDSKIWIRDGGFRENATVVFILKPLKCSDGSNASSDYKADQVEFEEFPSQVTSRLSQNELYSNVASAPETNCPPAARAVRACTDETEMEVFIVVNASGQVVFTRSLGGHPLMRAGSEAGVLKWKFLPLKKSTKLTYRSGTVVVKFEEGPEISTN